MNSAILFFIIVLFIDFSTYKSFLLEINRVVSRGLRKFGVLEPSRAVVLKLGSAYTRGRQRDHLVESTVLMFMPVLATVSVVSNYNFLMATMDRGVTHYIRFLHDIIFSVQFKKTLFQPCACHTG